MNNLRRHSCAKHCQKIIFLIVCAISCALSASAQSYSKIVFDGEKSENFGSENLITLHRVLYSFEDKHLSDTLFHEFNFVRKTVGFGYRMAKLLLLDAQIDGFIALSQHEVFGHGSRFREFGFIENSFNLNLYPPFGNASGFANRGKLKPGYKYPTAHENIAINLSGVEGEMLLANKLSQQLLLDDTLHYRQGLLFLITQNNQLLYLWFTRLTKPENIKPGNDMENYVNRINFLYPTLTNKAYDIKKLSNQSLVSFINPLQIYSAFTVLYSYGVKGKKKLSKRIPMINLGNTRFLPLLNFSLTPFGRRYHLVNYFRYQKILFSGDFNFGETTSNYFYGISLKCFNIINRERFTLNFHLDFWDQPRLELDSYQNPTAENNTGEALKVDFVFRPNSRKNSPGLFVQAGYKTKGYVMGEPLDETFILRYGLSMHL